MTLKAKRAALVKEGNEIREAGAKQPDGLTDAQVDRLEAINAEVGTLDAKIKSEDRRFAALAGLDAATKAAGAPIEIVDEEAPAPKGTRKTTSLPPGGASVGQPGFMGDPRRGFADMGEFALRAVELGRPSTAGTALADERVVALLAASGQSQGVPSEGGMLVPPAFSTAVWEGMKAQGDSLVPDCDSYTIPDGADSLTLLANAETSRATGSRWGAIRGYWRAEAGKMTESKIKLREVKLEPNELYVFTYVTDKLLRNAGPAVEQLLVRAASEEISFLVNDAIVEGTGAGQPKGYLGCKGAVTVEKEGGQLADTVVKENVDKMWSRCFARSRTRAQWLINQDIEPELEKLTMNVGTGGVPVYLPPGGIAETPNARMKGRPVRAIEWASTLGDLGDCSLVDLKAYVLGMRGSVQSAMSMHLRFDYGESAFRWTFEIDGQPWITAPLTPFKGNKTLSPFVLLEAR